MPSVPSFAVGMKLTPVRLNFLLNRPVAHLRQTVAQSIATGGAFKVITFTSEIEDSDPDGIGGHSNTTNPSRWTCRYPGSYQLSGGVGFAVNATGSRGCAWLVNGSVVDGSDVMVDAVSAASTSSRVAARTTFVRLNEGDYVELGAFQSSGAALDTVLGSAASSMSISFDRA